MEHFNQVANTWDTPDKIETSIKYAAEISKFLNSKKLKILEVGCGTGLLGNQLVSPDTTLLGVDTSSGMLEVFNEKFKSNPAISSKLINLEKEELDSRDFNLIISAMAFHHLIDPEKMLLKLKNLTVSNGILAIIDLDEEDGSFHPDPKNMSVHHFGFSRSVIQTWAKNCELKLLERKIVHEIHKNDKVYSIALNIFQK